LNLKHFFDYIFFKTYKHQVLRTLNNILFYFCLKSIYYNRTTHISSTTTNKTTPKSY